MKSITLRKLGLLTLVVSFAVPAFSESDIDISLPEAEQLVTDSLETTTGCCAGGDFTECGAAQQTLPPLPEDLPLEKELNEDN